MTRRGKFITLEGVEGSGKTTQAALLCDYLRREGVGVVETREPGGTTLGEKIRQILLAPDNAAPTPLSELFLFLAARAQQVEEVILPALERGEWVVCDRFYDATIAYQGYGRRIKISAIKALNEIATGGLKPDVTAVLDLDVGVGIKRALAAKTEFSQESTGDRMEKEDKEFHNRVRQGYLRLAEEEPDRIKVIPVTGSIEDIHRTLVSLVEPFLVKTQ